MSNYICTHTCAYRTNAGYCGKTGGYESCQYIKYLEKLEKEKTNIKPYAGKRTNADRVRSMSDEKLARWIALHPCLPSCPAQTEECFKTSKFESCTERWLDWLKREVSN